MKKSILLFLITLFVVDLSTAQDKVYLVFEFMKVDNDQESDYAETEAFWEKIHAQRVKSGDIIGWDLWSLQPGGEGQGYQYLTVQVYNDPVKMMSGASWANLMARAKAAYPGMSEEELNKKLEHSNKTRDLEVRYYLEQIDKTKGDFDMPLGMVASMDLMKVAMDNYDKYEKAESEVFKPMHQKEVDAGRKGSWELLRIMSPVGSDTYASHITVNMFKDYSQVFSNYTAEGPVPTDAQMKAIQEGLTTRDMKWVYMATLIKKVRK